MTISRRNFDPETRTLRKRTHEDDEELQDTVEKDVEGLAAQIVAEDEQKRAEELASCTVPFVDSMVLIRLT